jgi:NAD(P)H dehydrogenase (quinone)
MKIGITGATGQFGRHVVSGLRNKVSADSLVAVVRSPQKAASLGVEVREADYEKSETLEKALTGIDTLLLISGSEIGKRAAQHHNIIAAAKKTGIKWIVYTSILHADTSAISLAKEHYATELELKDAGIPFTLLRNGWYTENYTGSIPGAVAGGALIGSAGEGKISSAARVDYADAAVAVLTGKGHEGKIYELAGDESWTLGDLAAEISRQTGKDIPYKNMPGSQYAAALIGFGLPESLAEAIAGWDVAASHGALFEENRQLSALIGRATTPMSASVTEALKITSVPG